MIYYELSSTVEAQIVGVTDGAGQAWIDRQFLDNHKWFNQIFYETELAGASWWEKWSEITKYAQKLSEIKMEKKAKHTDYINFPRFMRGFIVNNRLREILENAHLPNHKFLEVTFNQNEKIIDGYWWFVFDMETGENTVDFSKCEYDLRYHKRNFGEDFSVNIKSYQDYLKVFYKTGSAIGVSKLVFNNNFDNELDLFGMQFLGSRNYISKRLLKQWQDSKILGYVARSPEEVKSRALRFNDSFCELIFDE